MYHWVELEISDFLLHAVGISSNTVKLVFYFSSPKIKCLKYTRAFQVTQLTSAPSGCTENNSILAGTLLSSTVCIAYIFPMTAKHKIEM